MTSRAPESSSKVIEANSTGLGTFGGVFTPSILTILGVIMYLRFGWVVGQMGLVKTLLIVTISTAITFITGLSISAIATDKVVRAGGAYYMISRSLGIETGGAVG
ncbi:MAG: Na-K-Cl cotransporter, partial [Cyanobacteria bacterium J06636_28]